MALLATDIGGEKRFLSTIAKRLASLGALTRGDRAASGGNLANSTLRASTAKRRRVPSSRLCVRWQIRKVGVRSKSRAGPSSTRRWKSSVRWVLRTRNAAGELEVPNKAIDDMSVGRLLNRVLALEIPVQNFLFNHFVNTLERIIEAEKAAGKFDEGVSDIKGENIRIAEEPKTGRARSSDGCGN
jgi:hypothetical protein